MALSNYSKSTTVIGDADMTTDAFSNSKFQKPPKVVLDSTRPEKVKRLHEKQLGIMDVFDYHIGDDRNWLTATQMRVLHYFFARFATEKEIDLTDVPYQLNLKSATVNRIVQTFSGNEKFGKSVNWFNSNRNLSDARKVDLTLTTAGVAVMNDLTLAMQVEVYGGMNPNVDAYRNAEAAAAKVKVLEEQTTAQGLGLKAEIFSQIKGTGQVGNVEIKTENVTTGAPEVPEAVLELGKNTKDILTQLKARRTAKAKYDEWRNLPEVMDAYARREGKVPRGEPFLTRNGEKLEPPVSAFELIMDDKALTAFAVQMTNALEEQLSTAAKEQLIFQAIQTISLREWNVVKDHLRQHNDNKLRTRKWLADEQERIMANAATIASPSERQDYIAQEYASRRNAEIEAAAQVNAAQQEQLREQIADELRVTLRDEVREEVKQELLNQLLKGE